jgi:predicted nuclease of predicted toxin-antitoxin system
VRILANENVPGVVVESLRAVGHEVAWMRIDAPGSRDRDVLSRAQSEGRVLVTFDKDFGELAFRAGLPADCGVILLRITAVSAPALAGMVVTALNSRNDWNGQFAVVERDRIRMTPLPGASSLSP